MLNDLNLTSVETALSEYLNEIADEQLEYETINIEDALSRITYEDIVVKSDQPASNKALIDGYALRAKDITFADASDPVPIKVIGEVSTEGCEKLVISEKEAVKICQGAFLPENADAVILPEDALEDGEFIKVFKSILTDSGVAKRSEDLKAGEIFIKKQRKLRPQDIGGIIGVGCRQVKVFKKPVVTIIPTGNELVPLDIEPDDCQIISSNGYVLKGFVEQLGCVGRIGSIVKDDLDLVKKAVSAALEVSDIVFVSGGSSIGSRDYTLKAVQNLENSKIIAHGISMRPGGHVMLALVNNKPVIGLPGHPVSSMTCFNVFGRPVLRKLAGTPRSFWQERKDNIKLDAFLAKNIRSPEGKEDYVRVRLLETEEGKILAYPYAGKSAFLSTLVRSHGVVRIPAECTSLYEGDRVEVMLF